MLAGYAAWLEEQPLSTRTREAYLAAVTAFMDWLRARDGGVGDALVAPRARDLAARDYKRFLKVEPQDRASTNRTPQFCSDARTPA